MKLIKLALRNLLRQKRRSILLGSAIAFGILFITLINGFTGSFIENVGENFSHLLAGHIFIDGVEMDKWAGETPWDLASFEVTSGNHVFEWLYTKDQGIVSGSDCVWIDYIIFPPLDKCTQPDVKNSNLINRHR